MHPECGVLTGQRQGEQQSRDELRGDRPVHLRLSAADRAADPEGEVSAVVAHLDTQPSQGLGHHPHRAAEQRAAPLDRDRGAAERGHGGEEPCGQPRFADREPVAARVEPAADPQHVLSLAAHFGAECFDAVHGRAGVVAEFDVAQHGFALREKRGGQGALCVAFRAGWRQRAFDAARPDGPIHFAVRPFRPRLRRGPSPRCPSGRFRPRGPPAGAPRPCGSSSPGSAGGSS